MYLADAVDALYAVPLPQFVETRTRLAQEAKGDDADLAKEITALRKPTLVAWLLNQVARTDPEVVAGLNDLGERMRSAQAKGDGVALAEVRPERDERIDALVDAARACAAGHGQTFGPSAVDQVGSTAVAVLADASSGRALASGSLLRALSYAGFGEVELDDAMATPLHLVPRPADSPSHGEGHESASDSCPSPWIDEGEDELAAARDELRELERSLSAARLTREEAHDALRSAEARVDELEGEVEDAQRRLADLAARP